jgi:esterase/lipase superfamily enzyme
VQSYVYDENSAEFSIAGFRQLIALLQGKTHVSTIHVIAHSMGNRIVLGPFREGTAGIAAKSLGELVLAAPDVDRDVFQEEAANIVGFKGITLYASSKDWALKASETLAGYPRAGQVIGTPAVILPSIETIDASLLGQDLLGLNHDTFAASAALCDIGRLLVGVPQAPNLRTPVIRSMPGPPLYWKYTGIDPGWSAKTGCE